MLQKIKYETLDYGSFDKMRKQFLSADFDPDECRELELSRQHSKDLPTPKCFEIVKNLSVLILSHNQISRFNPKILTRGAPFLEVLDLQFNRIDILDDIIDLGTLVHLKVLAFSGNPVANRLSRINTIIELFYPEKYKKYDPVAVLTAGYQQHPRTRLTLAEEEQMKKDLQVNQRFNEELEEYETRNTVSKYNHKNTLAKFAVEPCPVPRKCRFKNLESLNGEDITKLDMMRASGKDKIKDIIEDEKEDKIPVKRIHRENPESHKKYLDKYIKRIARMNEANQRTDIRGIKMTSGGGEGGDDDLKYLSKVDSALAKAAANKIDPKKFAADIWQTPLDMIYKDSTFTISMKDYKEMLKTYDIEKKQKEERRKEKTKQSKLQRRDRVYKKLLKAGIQPVSDEEMKKYFEDYDSETENQNTFGKRRHRRAQPREIDEKEYSSSESDKSERLLERQNSSFSLSSQHEGEDQDDDVDAQQQEEEKQKSRRRAVQHKEVDVLMLKKNIDEKKLSNLAQNKDKPYHTNIKKDSKKEEDKKPKHKPTVEKAHELASTPQPSVQIPSLAQGSMDAILLPQKQEQKQSVQFLTPSSPKPHDQATETQLNEVENTLPVSQYHFKGVKQAQSHFQTSGSKESFQIKNKIFARHDAERESQQRVFSAKAEGKVGPKSLYKQNQMRDRQRSSSSSASESENDPKKSVTSSAFRSRTLKTAGGQNSKSTGFLQTTASYSRQKTSKNTWLKDPNDMPNGTDSYDPRKMDIPTEELVPTVEQGFEADLRTGALFNPDNEMHEQIQKFKQNLENCNTLKVSIAKLDEKLASRGLAGKKPVSSFPRTISYNDVFNHLKSSLKGFQMMKSRDPGNHLEYRMTRKKKDPMASKKMSTFELNTIIQKANDYDQMEGPRIREKEINEQLEQAPKDNEFVERAKLYDGLDILEEIKLKKMKISSEHLRRIEKKEIERAEHDARLAYHYYKLRNHVDDGNLEKYLKRLNIGLDGKNDQGRIQFKKQQLKKNSGIISTGTTATASSTATFFQNKSALQDADKKKKERGFVGHYEDLMKLKKEVIDQREIPEVNISGYILEKNPDINEWANSRLYVPQPKLTFEEMMEQNDRRVKEEFQKSRNNQVLSIEEQMMKYAQEFKEKEKQRDDLRKRVEGYVKDGTKLLDEFLKQEMLDIDKRYDPTHCMNEYIKLMREDRLPKRIPQSAIKKSVS